MSLTVYSKSKLGFQWVLYPYYIIFDPRKLGYKILSGYVWSYLHCSSVKYVAKTDDNVVLDLDKLVTAIRTKQYQHDKWVACTTPNRNSKVIRGGHFHMRGEEFFIDKLMERIFSQLVLFVILRHSTQIRYLFWPNFRESLMKWNNVNKANGI